MLILERQLSSAIHYPIPKRINFKIFTGHHRDRIVAMGQGVSQNQLSGMTGWMDGFNSL